MPGRRADRSPPVRPGETVTVTVTGLGHAGEGVGRAGGFALFVPGALPGERVEARVTEVHPRYGRAELMRVLDPSPERVPPPCGVYARCGGCQLQHLDYAAQLREKRQRVRDALERIGGLRGVTVHPVLGMADPWWYRHKAAFPVGWAGGRAVLGFYAPGTHDIVDVVECRIQHPLASRVLAEARELIRERDVSVYDEAAHRGDLRHVLVRVSHATGEALVVLVTARREVPGLAEMAAGLIARVPGVASVWQNVNPARTNVILGPENVHLAGRPRITERILGLEFRISPVSFFQVNPAQAEILYERALAYAGRGPRDVAVDLYAGTGTISLLLARDWGSVHGVESVPEAVEDAWENARRNGVTNVRFHAGEAEEILPRLWREGLRPRAVVLDPPRQGAARTVLEAAAAMGPERIVYVSCNPSTLARDLAILAGLGYRTVEVQPVDMFPHTAHIEAVTLLHREHR
ncbi:23S rRNA (uracil(1939)-C(5))-methyltransferase RlmD [Caldinitratiruptor microaerophilus]|uniref:23S rRNA (Uracil-5-)-methyltransferase RumA n=1 Tax=Caldinitratiruptor microaerophilus TaxID=671077 RepID=A0AA35CL04_9FIRM|nr:23S rRNA (uracil(1939)-C(5))-methyltransferase RlmD [Caldinitratiruptor microaerophilus]BDG61245.1 23S rRNA (uracil-5-)-methyltransferase RumA [Caldinitratiruptor microaerophilus]